MTLQSLDSPLRRADRTSVRKLDESTAVAITNRNGLIHLLLGSSLAIWSSLGEPRDPASLISKLCSEFSAPPERVRDDVLRSLDQMLQRGLIEPVEATPQTVGSLPSEGILADNSTIQASVHRLAMIRQIPISGLLELSYRCNEDCVHCYAVRTPPHPDLSTAETLDLFDQLEEAGCLQLTLTGGEVFMRRDLDVLLDSLSSRGFSVRINTNGTRITDDRARMLAEADCIESVNVSLYSEDPAVHDSVTRRPGSHVRSLRGITALRRHGLRVGVNCSVMRANFDGYRALEALALSLGCTVRMDPVLVCRDDGNKENLHERLSDPQLESFYRQRFEAASKNELSQLIHPKRFAAPEALLQEPLCTAGRSYFGIAPNGDVFPCFQLKWKAGNLREQSFLEIWRHSPALQAMRDYTVADLTRCRECASFSYCRYCCAMSYLEDGDLLGPSAEACRDASIRTKLIHELVGEGR